MSKNWNILSVKKYALEHGCEVLSDEYIKNSEKLLFKCKCGNKFERTWNDFKDAKQYQCDECAHKATGLHLRYDIRTVKNIFLEHNLTLLDTEYLNANNKMTAIDKDGYKYFTTLHALQSGNPCCFGNNNPYTIENIKNYLLINNIPYILMSDKFISANKNKLKFKCNHGHEFWIMWNDFKSGYRCKECHLNTTRKTNDEFKSEVYNKYGNDFTILGKYKTNKDKILIRHNPCNTEFEVRPFELLCRWHGCPVCCISKGESKCLQWLKSNNLDFKQEYSFKDLVSEKGFPLRYDFAVFNSNNDIICLIEYDGEFHYRDVINHSNFLRRKTLDKVKDRYAKKHDIELIRIPYWDYDNIEKILDNKLRALSIKLESV